MLPVLLEIGPVTVYSFGLFLFLGFFLFCYVVWKQARLGGLPEERVLDTLFLTVFLSLIIGRIAYVWSYRDLFSADLSRVVLFYKYPGLSFPTMVVTALVVSGLVARNSGLPVLWVWDIFGFAGAFFAVFGSVGCLLDGCSLPTALPLYLAVLAVILVAILVSLTRKFSANPELAELAKQRGLFFLCYLIFQGLSLLMTTWYTGNTARLGVYLVLLVAVVIIFLVRYRLLFRYVYRSISQRRS